MNIIKTQMKNTFKWTSSEFIKAILGCAIFAFAINFFIVPNSLYNGGILGIAQLIRSSIQNIFHIKTNFDIAGILNFILNVPLFILAYRKISKTFFARTLICVIFQTIFLTIIPSPNNTIIDDLLTNVLIGGIIAGFGCGMTLSSSGSGGGTDIIGIAISMNNRNLSVGKIGASINIVIYTICGIIYGIPTMVYSIIYAVITSLVVDNTHEQNICSYVMIFTKTKPVKIKEFIKKELGRDVTIWNGVGGYDNSKTYICYSAMSKYEMQRLDRHISELDKHAFMIKSEGIGIDGNFKKNLTE